MVSYKPIMVENAAAECVLASASGWLQAEPEVEGVFAVICVTCALCPTIRAPPALAVGSQR